MIPNAGRVVALGGQHAGFRRAGGRHHGPDLVGRAATAGAGRAEDRAPGARLQHGADSDGDLVPERLAGPGERRQSLPVPGDGDPRGLHGGPDGRGTGGQHGPGGRAAQLRRAHRPGRGAAAAEDAEPGAAGRGGLVIVALALFGYAALLLTIGPVTLARARWPDGAPRLAIAAWFVLTGSAVASVIAGGIALMVPTVRVSADLARLLAACVMALRAQYAHPGGAALTGAGAVLALAVLARVGWCTAWAPGPGRMPQRPGGAPADPGKHGESEHGPGPGQRRPAGVRVLGAQCHHAGGQQAGQ